MKIQKIIPLGDQFGDQWPVLDPFLFCVHHYDKYPAGNGSLGLDQKYFQGRSVGQDFVTKDGFRTYHGEDVPGFPVHPHRGFETVTIVRQGYVDHADSLGAAGRYGMGDVQWMTAGSGVQHSEMFPLIERDKQNTIDLFQIWLNLPAKDKMAPPHFSMFWSEKIPRVELSGNAGWLTVIAGEFGQRKAPTPPPQSWALDPQNGVKIFIIRLNPQGKVEIPSGAEAANRMVYFFKGEDLVISGQHMPQPCALMGDAKNPSEFINLGSEVIELLLLEAVPIGEPVFQYGPFVMNQKQEVIQAYEDYQRTHFGGWSWERPDMVHGLRAERFARYPNGEVETPSKDEI